MVINKYFSNLYKGERTTVHSRKSCKRKCNDLHSPAHLHSLFDSVLINILFQVNIRYFIKHLHLLDGILILPS